MTETTTLHHFYAGDVQAAKVTDTPRGGNNGTGYGAKIPTPYMLRTFGPGPKWLRVYVVNYGNAGSAYVTRGGVDYYLSPGAELILETIRDGGTVEAARLKMAEWPEWMLEGEHLKPAPATRYVIAVFEPYMMGQGPRANKSELVTDWTGVAAHLERAGVDVSAAENILKSGGAYRYRDTAGKWCRVMVEGA